LPLIPVLVLGAACGVGAEDHARAISADRLPAGLSSTPPIAAPVSWDGRSEQTVELWFVRDGTLSPVLRTMAGGVQPVDVLDALQAGPAANGGGPSLRSALVDLELFRTISRSGGVAVIDLDASFSSLPSGEQLLASAQVVCTLTSLPGIGMVLFRLAGEVVDVPTGDGTQSSGPVSRDDYRLLIAG
jgi:spore germination protein GerM